MTSFARVDPAQPNLVDGSVYAYEVHPQGAYVTVAGNDKMALILSFDREDIAALRRMIDLYDRSGA